MNPLLETEAWLRLALIPGLGPRSQVLLLRRYGSPQGALQASASELQEILRKEPLEALLQARDQAEPPGLNTHLAWLAEHGNTLLTLGDPRYPTRLLDLPDPPAALFAKGRIELLNNTSLAIVGSRQATAQGLDNAELFAAELSGAGICIISGMAAGIDAAAHRGGLRGMGATVAVIGTGLDRVYPASNRKLAHDIAENGVLLSEFPLGYPPMAENFPRRNRLIAALGSGCLVVEATLGSGSLITARQAADLGREVFAIPGSIHSPQSKGCHRLIKDGAKLVEAAKDIYDELALPDLPGMQNTAKTDNSTSPLLDLMGWEPVDIETLAVRSKQAFSTLSSQLLTLELDNKIEVLPGGRYQRRK